MEKSKSGRGRGRPPKYPKPPGQALSTIRFQVSLSVRTAEALEKYRKAQDVEPEKSAVMEKAMEEFLIKRGYLAEGET